ncbi:MAG: PKD domain-containing protein [Bacteroidota bacterium]
MLLLLGLSATLRAGGIQDVAPTAADAPVMLLTNDVAFGNFAAFNSPVNSRLNVTIADPSETLFIGLGIEYNADGTPFPGSFPGQYTFRIRGPGGNIVHGPFIVDNNNFNIDSYANAAFGSYPVTATQGGQLMYQFSPPSAGDYSIEFADAAFPDGTDEVVNIPFWDFTVVDAANQQKPGRLWSRNWAFRTPRIDGTQAPDCVWDRAFNGDLYSYTTDGFVSRIDFANAGLQGLSFNVTFNRKGPGSSGDLNEDRKSIPGVNATQNSAEHQIFLVEPDPIIFPSGICGELTTPMSFSCLPQDSFCLEVSVTKPGQVEVVLDFNQNGLLDANSQDINLIFEFTDDNLTDCIPWDGFLGDGTRVSAGDTVNLIFSYTQGIQHWSGFDVEYLRNGYCIETVRPSCQGGIASNLLYWDDTNIPEDPGTGAPKDGRNGAPCTDGIRTWSNFNLNTGDCSNFDDDATSGYGDKSTINTWWFANTSTMTAANIPVITAMIEGPDQICGGETAIFVATDEDATGQVTYAWTGPDGFTATTREVSVSAAGEYCVTIMDEENCQNTVCKTLLVLDLSDGNVIYPPTIDACLGDVITIMPMGSASANYTYQWSPAGLVSPADSPTPTFTVTGSQVFEVTVSDPVTGCMSMQTLTVNQLTEPNASFVAEVGCEQGLEINFNNTSTDAATFQWDFGDPSTLADVSTLPSPSYTYPGPGTYAVSLTATSADGCEETFVQNVEVINVTLAASFEVQYDNCSPDAVTVNFINTSTNEANNATEYLWTFSGNGTSTQESPSLVITTPQIILVNLTITTEDGCTSSVIGETVNVQLGAPVSQFPAVFTVCNGEARTLDPAGDPAFNYTWSPAAGIDDVNSNAPTFNIMTSQEYMVTVVANGDPECAVVETIQVNVAPDLNLDVQGGGIYCTGQANLTATTDVPTTVQWFDAMNNLVATGNNFTPLIAETATYTAVATDEFDCSETSMSVTVSNEPVDVEVTANGSGSPVVSCFGDEVVFTVNNLDADDDLTYLWTPASAFVPGTEMTASPDFIELAGTTQTVTVTVSNQFGCTQVDELEITVQPDINLEVTINGGDGNGNYCEEFADLTATVDVDGSTIEWQDVDGNVLATGPTFNPLVSGVTEYIIVATAPNGCTDATALGEVTISGGPVDVTLPDTAAVCFGQDLLINAINDDPNDILTYLWEPTSAFVPGTETTASPDYIETIGPADLTVTITNQFGCETTEIVHVAVVNPNINLSFTDEIDCNGGTVQFTNTSTDAFGYVWDFGDGSPPNFEENPEHTYGEMGTYIVTLSIVYDVDCVTPFVREVTVEEPQIFSDFTFDISECSSEAATVDFTDISTNTLNNTVGWSWTFENGTPATSTEQNPQGIVFAGSGPVTVCLTIFTANNCENTRCQTLDIQLVDLDIALSDTLVVCPGASITLNENGNPDLVHLWTPAEGLDDPTATSPVATPTETTTYSVTAYSTVGSDTCFVMDQVVLFVPPTIDLELDQEPVVTTCGEDVIITATAAVDIDVTWTSALDGVIGTGSMITVNPFRTDTITATATDEFGCTETASVIIIDEGVDINITPGGDGSLTICAGVETTLTVNNEDDEDTLTYEWSPAELINGPTDQQTVEIEIFEAGTTVVTAIVTNQNNCVDTVDIAVEVIEFEAELPDTIFVCFDTPTSLNPGGNTTYTYNWEPTTGLDLSNPADPIATLTEDQIYMVTTTDPATGCSDMQTVQVIVYPDLELETEGGRNVCDDTPVTLTASTAFATDIEWFFEGESVGTGTSIDVVVPQTGGCYDYTAVATDPETGCEQTSVEQICFMDLMDVLPDDELTICPGEPTPINPGGDPDLTYEWSPVNEEIDLTNPHNPVVTTTVPQTYSVTVTDEEFGCTASTTVTINLFDPVNIEVSPQDTALCANVALTLTATTDIPATITWFSLPDNEQLGTGATLTYTPPLGASQVYAVGVSNDGCTENSDTVTVNTFPINATVTSPLVICEPTTSEVLEVFNNDPEQELTYNWEPLGVLTATDQAVVTVDPNVTTDFAVTVTNQFGCEEVLTTTVTAIDLAGDLSISAEPDTVLVGNSTTITVEGCVGCTYDWDPPAEDSPVIEVFPEEEGENVYFVTVSLLGCEEDLAITVIGQDGTCDTDHVFFPNAFTPNGDSQNDVLRLRSNFLEELTEMELLIYNRWGEEMFRTTNPFAEWDGTYRGEALAPDTYGFYLRVVCPNGDELVQKGNVTLLR